MKVSEEMVERALHVYANSGPTKDVRMRAALEAALSALPPDGEAVAVETNDFIEFAEQRVGGMSPEAIAEAEREADELYQLLRPGFEAQFPSPGNADRSEGVRALDGWRHIPSLNVWSVATPLGVSYWAWERDGRGFWCRFNSNERIEVAGGLTGAQGGAQADFDQRVRSCFSPPQTEEGDKRVVEARDEALREAATVAEGFMQYQVAGEISAAILALRNKP